MRNYEIQAVIEKCISKQILSTGQSLYHKMHHSEFDGIGDESTMITMIYANNQQPGLYGDNPELDEEISNKDTDLSNELDNLEFNQYKKIPNPESGLTNKWISASNDTIEMRFSDHGIYIIIYESGQY